MSITGFDLDTAFRQIEALAAQPLPDEPYWYGLGYHILDMCELPATFPLRFQMHHGPMIDPEPFRMYTESRLPILICHEGFAETLQGQPGRKIMVLGAPQVRYRRYQGIVQDVDACGTIAFPCHSTHHIDTEFDHSVYAEQLRTLPERFQPVSVCIYALDLLKGRHRPYLEAGLPILSAGHMADPGFTTRLYDFLRRARFTTGNEIGTHSILSLEMGIPYFHSGPQPRYRPGAGAAEHASIADTLGKPLLSPTDYNRPKSARLRALIPTVTDDVVISPDLAALIQDIHGCDDAASVDDVRRFILDAYVSFYPATQTVLRHARKTGDFLGV